MWLENASGTSVLQWIRDRISDVQKWRTMEPEKRTVLVRTFILLLTVRVALRVVSFRTVRRWMSPTPTAQHLTEAGKRRYQDRVVWAVHVVGRRIVRRRPCLPQALVAHWLLGRRGIETSIYIGVAKSREDDLLAHAWVERNGKAILGGRSPRREYVQLRAPGEEETS